MREGMDEMCRYEGKTEKSERVYTYEKAVERYDSTKHPRPAERTIIYATYFDFEVTILFQRWYQSLLDSVSLL